MTREPDYVSQGRDLDKGDLDAAVDLLYETLEQAWANGEKFYSQVMLIKQARALFGLGLLESKHLVDAMREKYRQNIRDMGF